MAVDDVAGGEAGGAERPRPSARAVVIKVFVMAGSPFASATADVTDNADRTARKR
jgi:hypothetical protein